MICSNGSGKMSIFYLQYYGIENKLFHFIIIYYKKELKVGG